MTDDNNCEKIMKESKCSVQHLNDLEYIQFARDGFDKKLFPNDFDKWTVREQCVWINENIATFFPHVPQSLVNLIPASFHELNHDLLTEKPAWLDMNKYLRGRKFVNDHYGSVVISQMFSLVQSFSFDHVLKPIIISKHFDTPYLVFKRYFFLFFLSLFFFSSNNFDICSEISFFFIDAKDTHNPSAP